MENAPDVTHDLVIVIPAGVAIAVASAVIWFLRWRANRDAGRPPPAGRPGRRGGNNDVP